MYLKNKKGAVAREIELASRSVSFLRKGKKGVSEITSFVLITLIVVVSSTIAYVFAKNSLDENIAVLDVKNMNIYFKKMYYSTSEITSFDGSSSSIQIYFRTGELNFINNTITYQSLNPYLGSDYCFNIICTQNNLDYEKLVMNLTSNYYFANNLTLSPGSYSLLFKHIKNETKISVTFR